MNKIIPFNSPAVSYWDFTIDKALIASREFKIKGLVASVLVCLNGSIFWSTRRLAIMAAPTGLGIAFLAFVSSLATIRMISSRFAQWEEKRAFDALRKRALCNLTNKQACEWLVEHEEPAVLGKSFASSTGIQCLFDTALKKNQQEWLHFLWEKGNQSDLIAKYKEKLISTDPDFFVEKIKAAEAQREATRQEHIRQEHNRILRGGYVLSHQNYFEAISQETVIAEYV